MKYSYPYPLIITPATEQACLVYTNKYDNPVANTTTNNSTFLQLILKNRDSNRVVGIKFDNISARKYFVLIHATQQLAVLKKTTGKNQSTSL